MAREKDGYREHLEAIMRKVDPLPAQNIAKSGAVNKRYMFPVTALAKWSIG